MRNGLEDLPSELENRYLAFDKAIENDPNLIKLTKKRRALIEQSAVKLVDIRKRQIEMAKKAGLVFSEKEDIRKAFPGYSLEKIAAVTDRTCKYDQKPYERLRATEEDHFTLYHCERCAGWVIGECKKSEARNPEPSLFDQINVTYSCQICQTEIARDIESAM